MGASGFCGSLGALGSSSRFFAGLATPLVDGPGRPGFLNDSRSSRMESQASGSTGFVGGGGGGGGFLGCPTGDTPTGA